MHSYYKPPDFYYINVLSDIDGASYLSKALECFLQLFCKVACVSVVPVAISKEIIYNLSDKRMIVLVFGNKLRCNVQGSANPVCQNINCCV
jgi:hypothetical protein